ncbi:hypothetical protein GCM10023206_07290 [Acinetobacter puyangensis]|uniref:Uncharacterized protein n=1 Tax=Acinetobacter puyangensis TaxID=1096779 RepID=A0A240E6Q6_9GAMM|nr:hypothetical protein [Acinetobacter puyangensis]SNX44191.1 hypothetical protein SAMN05421731_102352 [Acinetobacter puyangensis]
MITLNTLKNPLDWDITNFPITELEGFSEVKPRPVIKPVLRKKKIHRLNSYDIHRLNVIKQFCDAKPERAQKLSFALGRPGYIESLLKHQKSIDLASWNIIRDEMKVIERSEKLKSIVEKHCGDNYVEA